MKNPSLLFRLVLSLLILQTPFWLRAQLCTSPQTLDFGNFGLTYQNSGASRNASYSCRAGNYVAGEKVFSFNMLEKGTVSLALSNITGADVDLFLLSSCSPVTCVASGATGIFNQSLNPGIYYVVVDGLSASTSSFQISMSGKTESQHCISDFLGGCNSSYIDSVIISAPGATKFQKLLTGCSANSVSTSVFTAPSNSIFREGSLVTVDARIFRGAAANSCAAWIDLNNNGNFEDAGEFLGTINSQKMNVFTFTVPTLTQYGIRRLRIRNMGVGGDSPAQLVSNNSCSSLFASGETEDYLLNLEPRNCTPGYTAGCTGNAITSFTLKGISNLNSGCNGNPFNYINYPESQFTTSLSRGATYTATISLGTAAQSAGMWIDYNADGDFLDANEFIGANGIASTFSQTFTVPSTVAFGKKKLRIRSAASNVKWSSALSCSQITGAGETEDYVINIIDQSLTLLSGDFSRCRGDVFSVSWTNTGDFLPGNRLFIQFSNSSGSFANASQNTDIELTGNSPVLVNIPSNLLPNGVYKVRLISTNPVRTSGSIGLTISTVSCSPVGLTTLRIGTTNELAICKGTSISIPFASVNIAAGSVFKAQISGPNGALPFTDIAGATGTSSPISAFIPLTLASGTGYRVRIMGPNGFVQNNSPTILNLSTCLSVASLPASICKGIPTTLTVTSTGIPAGTSYKAQLEVLPTVLPGNSTFMDIGTSNTLTSISVVVPCSVPDGQLCKINLIPTSVASGAGAKSGSFVATTCPLVLSTPSNLLTGNETSICLGKTMTSNLSVSGCLENGNSFFLDFLAGSPTGPVVQSILLGTGGSFSLPDNFPLSDSYFIRHRSTAPVATSAAVGPFSVVDCPRIILNSICRIGSEWVVDFTPKGVFNPGNQFKVSIFANPGPVQQLGNAANGSPMVVPVASPDAFTSDAIISVSSTNPVVFSGGVNNFEIPTCAAPSISIVSANTVLEQAATPGLNVTACPGGKLRIDFTTTGFFGSANVFSARILGPLDLNIGLGQTSTSSPLIVEIPANLSSSAGPFRIQLQSSLPFRTSDNQLNLALGTCPTMTTGTIPGSDLCSGSAISIPFTRTGIFLAGNVFIAELSDENGSFNFPNQLVGSGTTSPLVVTLPNYALTGGTAYKIRIRSSAPSLAGVATVANLSLLPPVLTNASVPKDPFIGDPVFLTGTRLLGIGKAFFGRTLTSFASLTNTSVQITIPTGFSSNECQVKRNGCLSNIVNLQDAVQAATNFNLFNATTDANLGVLKGGSTIDLTNLSNFNIRGNLNAPGYDAPGLLSPGSVKLELNGPVSQTVIDNASPFTLFGEVVRADGTVDFLGSSLPPGNYTIKATPYEFDNAVGNAGVVWTTAFSVAPPRAITTGTTEGSLCQNQGFEIPFTTVGLFNPETQFTAELSDAVGSFANPTIIGAGPASPISAQIPANQPTGTAYRIRISSNNPSTPVLVANQNGAITLKAAPVLSSISQSVVWAGDQVILQGTGFQGVSQVWFNGIASDNFGIQGNTNTKIKARVPFGATTGKVTIAANGGCTSLNGIDFIVPKISSFSVINTDNQEFTELTEGSAIALSANGHPSFVANVEPAVAGSVRFELSGTSVRNAKDVTSPFSFCGDVWDGSQTVYQSCSQALLPGTYALKATPYFNGGVAKSGESKTVNFTIINTNGRMAVQSDALEISSETPDFQIFPNPTTGKTTLRHSALTKAHITILSMLGQSVLEMDVKTNALETELDLREVPAGVYQVHIQSPLGVKEIRLIRN